MAKNSTKRKGKGSKANRTKTRDLVRAKRRARRVAILDEATAKRRALLSSSLGKAPTIIDGAKINELVERGLLEERDE